MKHQKKYHDRKMWKILGTMLNIDISTQDAHKQMENKLQLPALRVDLILYRLPPERISYLPRQGNRYWNYTSRVL
jgi:hypothetical protein